MPDKPSIMTPYISTISDISEVIYKDKGYITVEDVLKKLDKEKNYSKTEYRLHFNRVYIVFRFLQSHGWTLWLRFRKDKKKFERLYKQFEHYNNIEDAWEDETFKRIWDMHIFTREQMLESIIESKIFENFVEDLKNSGFLFLVSGKGKAHYVIPSLYDYCIYKYNNMKSSQKVLRKQLDVLVDDKIMLPEGITVEKLELLSNNILKAMEDKRAS